MRRHLNGFTLIELLVVISIIALLVGILLPALGAARRTAQDIQCTSNQRQVLIGLFGYANDYKQYYPAGDKPGSSDWTISIHGYISNDGSTYQTTGVNGNLEAGVQPEMECPSATIPGGRIHYSASRLVMPTLISTFMGYIDSDKKDRSSNPSPYLHYNADFMRRSSEIFIFSDGNQITGAAANGALDGQSYATLTQLDDNQVRKYEHLYRSNFSENNAPIDPGPNKDLTPTGSSWSLSNLRWRHGGGGGQPGSEGGQVVVAWGDGHAAKVSREDLLKRNVRADGP